MDENESRLSAIENRLEVVERRLTALERTPPRPEATTGAAAANLSVERAIEWARLNPVLAGVIVIGFVALLVAVIN